MATRLPQAFTLVCAFVALTITTTLVFASYNTLDAPSLTMAKDYPDADYEKIKAVLERKNCKFLGGAQLNAHTSLKYGGDTTALNLFVEALSLCPNVTVHVNFYRPGPGGAEWDWMVTQDAPSNELVVRINLESENVKLEALYLPPVKAEKPAEDGIASEKK